MRYFFLLLLCISLCFTARSQSRLSDSRQGSEYTYVYRIHADEARVLYASDMKKVNEDYLHSKVDSFKTDGLMPKLADGNYLLFYVMQNKLHYNLLAIGDVRMTLIDNDKNLTLFLHHKDGTAVTNATVYVKNKEIKFEPSLNAYYLSRHIKKTDVYTLYNNVGFSADLSPYWYDDYSFFEKLHKSKFIKTISNLPKFWKKNYKYFAQTTTERKYKGFIVLSKPQYKPQDTVKLKAFIVNNHGKPYKKNLLLRLSERSGATDTILGIIHPYRKGGFAYTLKLTDSLKLHLDRAYLLTLEKTSTSANKNSLIRTRQEYEKSASGRKVVKSTSLRYEDYELRANKFYARSDEKENSPGLPASLYFRATDENDLPVMDGRVMVTVTTKSVIKKASTDKIFLPDTLWQHTLSLEVTGETKLILPDSIFPPAHFNYEVHCRLYNSSNELQFETLSMSHSCDTIRIVTKVDDDSLNIDYIVNGHSTTQTAKLYALSAEGDTVVVRSFSLPQKIKLSPFAKEYHVVSGELIEILNPEYEYHPIHFESLKQDGSVMLHIDNRFHLPLWYSVFNGKKQSAQGYGDSLRFKGKVTGKKLWSVSVHYMYEGKINKEIFYGQSAPKTLDIEVNQPKIVTPGQTSTISLLVKDARGKPVPNTDLTAYSQTQKFRITQPNVPYLGKATKYHRLNDWTELKENYEDEKACPLNWQRWSKELHLDTNEYYKFSHPEGIYRYEQATENSTTQVAPFVVRNGDILPVNLLYIDDQPTFFQQAQQLMQYSFAMDTVGYHKITMRIAGNEISIDSAYLRAATKTILSVDADSVGKHITIVKKPDTMTKYEKDLWAKYMIMVNAQNIGHFEYIHQEDWVRKTKVNYLFNYGSNTSGNNRYPKPFLIGPLQSYYADFVSQDAFSQAFAPEEGYIFDINKGLIKQKQPKRDYLFSTHLSKEPAKPAFDDEVLNTMEIDTMWQQYLDKRAHNTKLFKNSPQEDEGSYNARLQLNTSADSFFIKSIILFKNNQHDFVHIYPGAEESLGVLPAGDYRLMLLMSNKQYQLVEHIALNAGGTTYYKLHDLPVHPPDKISRRLDSTINSAASEDNVTKLTNAVLKPRRNETGLSSIETIGKVTDESGRPLQGVIVALRGTNNAVSRITDENGEFNIKAGRGDILVFTYIGYIRQELLLSLKRYYSISMESKKMEEVVVTGYTTTKRSKLPFSFFEGKPGSTDNITFRGMISPLFPSADLFRASREISKMGYFDTSKTQNHKTTDPAASGLRKNFHDDAFWQPMLRTDDSGRASFTATFPDDITNWKTYYLAMGSKRRTGAAEGSIKSFKKLSGNLALPQFAIAGDSINVIGKALSYTLDTIHAQQHFFINDTLTEEKILAFRNVAIDTFTIAAHGKDSMKLKYLVQKTDGYFDGEERSIPLYKAGVEETKGLFATLDKDTSFTIQPDTALGKLTVHAETLLLPILEDEIEHIRKYEYLCNEQLASKLIALLYRQRVDALMGKKFMYEEDIADIRTKLSNGRKGLLWGWWEGNEEVPWISLHVIEALLLAEKAGYKANLLPQQVIDYCMVQLSEQEPVRNLQTLAILQQLKANVNYRTYTDSIARALRGKATLHQQLSLALIRQKAGINVDVNFLKGLHKQTMFGNWYWSDTGSKRIIYDNAVQNTLLAYHLLKNEGGHEHELRLIQNYFLEKRSNGHWENTYESARILLTIMPDILTEKQISSPATVTINGMQHSSFPMEQAFTDPGKVTIAKAGGAPVYFTAYQKSWNTRPARHDGDFIVRSSFEENNKTTDRLKAGEPVIEKVAVTVKADADYVMIEIPIPAGCSYKDKPQSWWGNDVHREYFKNKVSIFCQHLKAGNYTFDVSLTPRYTGVYQLNPAKAEMMYYPVFYGREAMKIIPIR